MFSVTVNLYDVEKNSQKIAMQYEMFDDTVTISYNDKQLVVFEE